MHGVKAMQNGAPAADRQVTIALDAMGGDDGPREIVEGGLLAAEEFGVRVLFVGDEQEIAKAIAGRGLPGDSRVVHASTVIGMDVAASEAVRNGRDSSVVVAARTVKEGKADAFVSAGNTGATMAAGLFHVGRIAGVERPAIATPLPTASGVCLVLDAGANAEVRPEHLVQFAQMGEVYFRDVFGVKRPRVGLLNVGGEASKGTRPVREAYELLLQTPGLHFIGNVEGNDIPSGEVDVVVCDGFVGNIVLKLAEGVGAAFYELLRKNVFVGWRGMLAGLLTRKQLRAVRNALDYAEYGGAPLLGVDGTVIIAHGRSDRRAIRNAVKVAAAAAGRDVPGQIRTVLAPALSK